MRSLLGSEAVEMQVFGEDGDTLLVDLKKMPMVSLREHLVFMELARYVIVTSGAPSSILFFFFFYLHLFGSSWVSSVFQYIQQLKLESILRLNVRTLFIKLVINATNGLKHRSLTGGPRSGSGPKSRPTRTRTYSQNIRLWSKTWRGASISTGTAFVFTVVVVETHRPITCELSHHVIPLSQSSLVNIATRQSADRRESSQLVTHEKTIERKRKIAIHVENKRRDTDDCTEKVEKQASKTEKGR